MERNAITNMILQNAMVLYGQPKWTFGKNTCNTYEVFVEYFRTESGNLLPAWPILEIIEQDDAMTMLFSTTLLWEAVERTIEISRNANSHLHLSLNILPRFVESDNFVQQVTDCLEKTGFDPKRLQFEISELQDLNDEGAAHLNALRDKFGISLVMGNFGTKHTNMPLLRKVHFDGLELDKSYSLYVPGDDMTAKIIVAIQQMADTTDMFVCAKGIENQEQFEFYEELGIYKGQGPMIGNPMPLDELEKFIKLYALPIGHA